MSEDRSRRGPEGGAPGGATEEGAGKVSLPPFGLAQEILRQMSTPEALPTGPAAERAPAPAVRGAAQAEPAATAPGSYRGRESLLQFADAVMSVPAREGEAPAPESEEHLVTFFLAEEEYGVPVLRSREIVRVGEITRIPEAPAHIRGVFNLRGRILPVVDLRTRLGLPLGTVTPRSRLILVEAHGRVLALLCDGVSRMTRVAASLVRPPPAEALSTQVDYVTGVAQVQGRLIILLDLDRVLLLAPEAAREPAPAEPRDGARTT
jgi:purine-binding chemotaxis protein CheW